MGHAYREINGTDRVMAWRVGDIVEYVHRHSDVPDVFKKFIDQGVLAALGHTNGTATIAMLWPGESPRELARGDYLLMDSLGGLSVMNGYHFNNEWTEIEEWVDSTTKAKMRRS